MASIETIIKKPLLTEKASIATENENKFGFLVDLKAGKNQIKAAVEELYDVKVLRVWTCILPGKLKRHGRHTKKTSKIKKAYVLLDQGQKIEFFKGV